MTGARDWPFDPVVVDLTDPQDYAILTAALEEYASDMESRADDEQDRITYNRLPEEASEADHWRGQADRARKIIADVERQLEANSAARQAAEEG